MKKTRIFIFCSILVILLIMIGSHVEEVSLNFLKIYEIQIISYSIMYPVLTFIIFSFVSVLILLFPIPMATITFFLAGLLYGFFYGFLLNLLYSVLAAVIGYFLAEKYLHNRIVKLFDKDLIKIYSNITKHTFFYTLNSRALNLIPYSYINYLSGLLRVKKKEYLFATLLGSIPSALILAYMGSEFKDISSIEEIITPTFVTFFVLYLLIINFSIILKYLKKVFSIKFR